MAQPLMPKATAVWLLDNTTLTFEQISTYCNLHALEVQAIADGEVAPGMQGLDPTINGQLSADEIKRCESDSSLELEMSKPTVPLPKARQKGARYTPISKRQDRPDAIAWLLRTYPELSDAQIGRLVGTTKPTINAVRNKTHRNTANIVQQSPVYLGLCSAADLETSVRKARTRGPNTSSSEGSSAPVLEEEVPPQTNVDRTEESQKFATNEHLENNNSPFTTQQAPSIAENEDQIGSGPTQNDTPNVEDVFKKNMSEK